MLSPIGDAEALAENVESVLRNPELAKSLAANALAGARRCDWQEVKRVLYRVYGFAPVAGDAPELERVGSSETLA